MTRADVSVESILIVDWNTYGSSQNVSSENVHKQDVGVTAPGGAPQGYLHWPALPWGRVIREIVRQNSSALSCPIVRVQARVYFSAPERRLGPQRPISAAVTSCACL